ncbi:MAG: hypothetical protein WC955_06260 [Elusimicrobiota bacterium]
MLPAFTANQRKSVRNRYPKLILLFIITSIFYASGLSAEESRVIVMYPFMNTSKFEDKGWEIGPGFTKLLASEFTKKFKYRVRESTASAHGTYIGEIRGTIPVFEMSQVGGRIAPFYTHNNYSINAVINYEFRKYGEDYWRKGQVEKTKRYGVNKGFEVDDEVYLFDGDDQIQQEQNNEILFDFLTRSQLPWGSERFMFSVLGIYIKDVVQEVSGNIGDWINEKKYIQGVVVGIQEDGGVFVNIGYKEGAKVGNKFMVYRVRMKSESVHGVDGSTFTVIEVRGVKEEKVGELELVEVKGQNSSLLRVINGEVYINDIVKQ